MSLRWSDERYVRVYVRDTPSWVLGPWEARAILPLVIRKLDRAGTIDLGADGLEALAALIAIPLEVVQAGMAWWLKRGTFELVDGRLVMPNFLDAQEATASDAQRQREHRARARDLARAGDPEVTSRDESRTKRDASVTERDGSVTRGHEESRPVTPSCAVPSRTERERARETPKEPERAPSVGHALVGSTLTPPPEDIPLTSEVLARFMGAPCRAPTREDVAACLSNARKKGYVRADWVEELKSWMIRQKSFDQRNASGGRPPEPANPYDGPAIREERARRERDRREAEDNAVPAPIDDLMAAIGARRT